MTSNLRLSVLIVLLTVLALAGYGAHRRHHDSSSSSQSRPSFPSAAESSSWSPEPAASAPPPADVAKLPQPSLLALHAAFRQSQRCFEEGQALLMHSRNAELAAPPHTPGCEDIKSAARRQYEATYSAAKAGDLEAQLCYLMQAAGDRDSGFMLTDAQIAEYRTLAPQFVDTAFQRGDWRVVELLGYHVVDFAGMFVGLEQWQDPTREYKAHVLLGLGADIEIWPSARLPAQSAQDVQDTAWAHEMYDEYFSSRPRLMKEPRICSDQDPID